MMNRTAAVKRFSNNKFVKVLTNNQVTLISAGLDEIAMAYKNIDPVVSQQKGLVETVAKFEPRLVKMASAHS